MKASTLAHPVLVPELLRLENGTFHLYFETPLVFQTSIIETTDTKNLFKALVPGSLAQVQTWTDHLNHVLQESLATVWTSIFKDISDTPSPAEQVASLFEKVEFTRPTGSGSESESDTFELVNVSGVSDLDHVPGTRLVMLLKTRGMLLTQDKISMLNLEVFKVKKV